MVIDKAFLFDFAQHFAPALAAGYQIVERIAAAVRIGATFAVHGGLGFIEKVFSDKRSVATASNPSLPAKYPVIERVVKKVGDHALADAVSLLASKAFLIECRGYDRERI